MRESMKQLTVPEWFDLIDAIAAAGLYSFTVRRVLQRLERGEITIKQAVRFVNSDRRGLRPATHL